MPNDEIIYSRGGYSLKWDRRRDGALRSPYPAIFWYDATRGRVRSASTATRDVGEAKRKLDRKFLEDTTGANICPTCHQPVNRGARFLLADAISNYLVLAVPGKETEKDIRARLTHVASYLATLPNPVVYCDQVDDAWVERFRRWALLQPIVSPTGKTRNRAPSTVENCVIHLAAAINFAEQRHDIAHRAKFRALQPKEVNRTPQYRLTVEQLAQAFRYAMKTVNGRGRHNLLRFLRASVATLARPDAAIDLSTKRERGQWTSSRRIIALNPRTRRQTRKYRATVKCPWQFAPHLDGCDGPYVTAKSIKKPWARMCAEFGWPGDGESGMKLIRRSMAQLLRERGVPSEQVEMQLGHRRIDSVSELYAPFQPGYLAEATAAIESIIDEIETLAPGAWHRSGTGNGAAVIPISKRKTADVAIT